MLPIRSGAVAAACKWLEDVKVCGVEAAAGCVQLVEFIACARIPALCAWTRVRTSIYKICQAASADNQQWACLCRKK